MIIFFDIDSTLVENRFSRRAMGDVLVQLETASGIPMRDLASEMGKENERRQQADPDHPMTMDWRDIMQTIANRYNVTLERDADALWNEYANPDEVDIVDDAPTMLEQLKREGHTLVIATKGLWKYQEPVLRVAGLLPFFDDFLTPDKVGYLKTSPGYFNSYTSSMRHPRPFVQVGDHYYDDVICAKRNGFVSIMRAVSPTLQEMLRGVPAKERPQHLMQHREHITTYPTQPTDILPDAVVVSLQEVPALVAELDVTLHNL